MHKPQPDDYALTHHQNPSSKHHNTQQTIPSDSAKSTQALKSTSSQLKETILTLRIPKISLPFPSQLHQWQRQLRKSLNEPPIVTCQTKKTSNFKNRLLTFKTLFPKLSNFDPPTLKHTSQMMFIGQIHKHIHKNAQNSLIKHHFCLNSKFRQTFKIIIHQQQLSSPIH